MHPEGDNDFPVRYFNGELQLSADDLASGGYGKEFGHTRIFSNRLGADRDFGNGINWMVRQLPQAYQEGSSVMVLRGTRSATWFDQGGGGQYTARYAVKLTLSHGGGSYSVAAPNGEVTVLNDFNSGNPGLLSSITIAGGQTLNVNSYAPATALGIGEVRRSKGSRALN